MRPSSCGEMPLPIACRLFNPASLHHFRIAFLATTSSCSSGDSSLGSTGAVTSDPSSDSLRSISAGSMILTGGLSQIALLFLLPDEISTLALRADASLLSLLKVWLVSVRSTTEPCFQRPTVNDDKKCCRSSIDRTDVGNLRKAAIQSRILGHTILQCFDPRYL
ncbi:hypothetical protein KCU81_g91, partial [Aureobasidium melanogenum]